MKIKAPQDLSNTQTLDDFKRFASPVIEDLVTVVNGRLSFIENCETFAGTCAFTAANSEIRVRHDLGRAPNGYFVGKRSANITVFDGVSANTNNFLFVQASGVGTVTLLVY